MTKTEAIEALIAIRLTGTFTPGGRAATSAEVLNAGAALRVMASLTPAERVAAKDEIEAGVALCRAA